MYIKQNIVRPVLFIGILVSLGSCTPQDKLNRLIKRNPDLISSYSIIKHDTIVTQSVSTDTVFNYFTKDTVVIREGKLTMKYFYNSHDSTVFLRGECATDTIYREYVTQINTVSAKETSFNIFKRFIVGNIVSLLILVVIIYIILRNKH